MILILNHKANFNYNEIKDYEKKLRKYKVIVMPSACYLSLFKKGNYILGSQDISEFKENNRTGEINGKQLNSLNVKYTLIGHADRKKYNNETKTILIEKANQCIKNNIIPLYCVGEENDLNEVYNQIDDYLDEIKIDRTYIIYEPIKNIDSSIPDLSNIENNVKSIKDYIKTKYNIVSYIIYGGGINLNNIDYLMGIKNIDGLIFSNTSLNIDNVKRIYDKANK